MSVIAFYPIHNILFIYLGINTQVSFQLMHHYVIIRYVYSHALTLKFRIMFQP
jgi:hypothetical protein